MSILQLFTQLKRFVRPYRLLVVATLILTFIGALAAQVNALVLRYAVDNINRLVESNAPFAAGLELLAIISAILLGKEVVSALVQFGQKFYGEKLRINLSKDLVEAIVRKMLTYRLAFFTEGDNEMGKLQARIDRGVASITRLIQNFFVNILPIFLSSLLALILMFNANVYVGLVGVSVIPLYYLISTMQAKKLKGRRRIIRGFRERQSQGILSIITSITVIKSFNREKVEGEKQFALQDELKASETKMRQMGFLFDTLKQFVDQIGIVLVIILTAFLVLKGYMTIGAIMFHILLFNNVSAPIRQLQQIYDEMSEALIYSEGYFAILNAQGEQEPSGYLRYESPLKGDFTLENVTFHYPNGTPALKNVSLHIPQNRITAIVGLSGAGKSTLISLLDRFYEPTSGTITLDGAPLADYDTHYLRDNIGLVLQKNHIFGGSIEENIRYGDLNATFEEVVTAAKKASIHEQIMALPEQYQSDALALSGGQQQRIAIARMFLKDPPIIFLDEPTASLDAIATEAIKNSLDAIKQNRTVIIISHSLPQIIDSDKIYVLESGEVVEEGDHESLFAKGGKYREIFDAMTRSLNLDRLIDVQMNGGQRNDLQKNDTSQEKRKE